MPPRPPRRPSCWPGSPVGRCLACWCRRWRSPGCCSACTIPATWPPAWRSAPPSRASPPGWTAIGRSGQMSEDVEDKVPVMRPPANLIVGVVKAMRPRQWVKNVLVLAAPLAALGADVHYNYADVLYKVSVAFVVFCLAASSVYLVNDVRDVEADRAHPTKRFRPIAAGVVPEWLAYTLAAVLGAASLGISWWLTPNLALVMAVYLGIQLGYCFGLKHQAVIDILIVSAGFLIRAIAGGVAAGIYLSQWFLLMMAFGSLFMGAGKR